MPELGETLSDRELEVLQCLSRGAGNKDIAAELFISENTVKVHLRNIYTKLGVSSRTEAATVALQQGVIVMPGVDTAVTTLSPSETAVSNQLIPTASPEADAPPPESPLRRWLHHNRRVVVMVLGGLLLLAAVAVIVNVPPLNTATTLTATPFEPVDIGENWKTLRPLPEPRTGMATTAVGLNLYVIAGETTAGVTDSVLVYHTTDHTWQEVAATLTAVTATSAAELFGEIFLPGGRLADGSLTDVVQAYSPTNNSWRFVRSLPQPMAGGLTLSDGSSLYFLGGWDGTNYLSSAYAYDPAANNWRPLPPMSQPRAYLTGGVIKGQLFAVGGHDGRAELATCEQFNPADETWTACPAMLTPRAGAGAASIVNKLYVIGGVHEGEAVTFSELFDPANATWSIVNTPLLAVGSWGNPGVANVETRLFALGGEQNEQVMAKNYLYSPLVYQTFLPAASSGEKDE